MGERAQLGVGSTDTVDELQAEIAHTREHVSETLDAIHDRLSPRTLAARASGVALDAAERTVANPLSAILIGAGLGCAIGLWRRRTTRYRASSLVRRSG
jgi:ElaB/YqjD/DUF883 family membrane-anchored ribosome-binding protein